MARHKWKTISYKLEECTVCGLQKQTMCIPTTYKHPKRLGDSEKVGDCKKI
jgi:hypothetical protein